MHLVVWGKLPVHLVVPPPPPQMQTTKLVVWGKLPRKGNIESRRPFFLRPAVKHFLVFSVDISHGVLFFHTNVKRVSKHKLHFEIFVSKNIKFQSRIFGICVYFNYALKSDFHH